MNYSNLPKEAKFTARYNFYKLLNKKIDKLIRNFVDNNHIDPKSVFYEIDFDRKQVNSLYVKQDNKNIGIIQNQIFFTDNNNLYKKVKKLYDELTNIINMEDINNYFFDEDGKIKQINSKNFIEIKL